MVLGGARSLVPRETIWKEATSSPWPGFSTFPEFPAWVLEFKLMVSCFYQLSPSLALDFCLTGNPTWSELFFFYTSLYSCIHHIILFCIHRVAYLWSSHSCLLHSRTQGWEEGMVGKEAGYAIWALNYLITIESLKFSNAQQLVMTYSWIFCLFLFPCSTPK
jgi:hypothetical protein